MIQNARKFNKGRLNNMPFFDYLLRRFEVLSRQAIIMVMVAVNFYTIMNIIGRKCYCLVLKLLKSKPTMLANQTQARFGFIKYPELPIHVFRHKKAPRNKAEANFESEWRRGRVELPRTPRATP